MKIDHKIILELSVEEAVVLRDFLCEFEGEKFGGSTHIWEPSRKRDEWIGWLLYHLSIDLEKFAF